MLNSISISIFENVSIIDNHGDVETSWPNLVNPRYKFDLDERKKERDLKQVHNFTQSLKVVATQQIIKISRFLNVEIGEEQSTIHIFMSLILI